MGGQDHALDLCVLSATQPIYSTSILQNATKLPEQHVTRSPRNIREEEGNCNMTKTILIVVALIAIGAGSALAGPGSNNGANGGGTGASGGGNGQGAATNNDKGHF